MSAPTDPAHHDTTVLGAVHPGSPGHPVQSRYPTTGIGAGGDPYTAPTQQAPHDAPPARRPNEPRTIRVRMAAVIAVVAFVIGLGVSMLLGPIMGPGPGGPGGPGQNGATTSQSGAATSQSGTPGTTAN